MTFPNPTHADLRSRLCNLYWDFTREPPSDQQIEDYITLYQEMLHVSRRRRLQPGESPAEMRAFLQQRFPRPLVTQL